ncbi:hypothetical protein [Halobacillus sp. A5]|uniref:hypothetical protein n=1 Tax=Halobacillus sp. A5 TaxID=2880263 RepID=UPI0020A64029|nr:hypothetical protein [Halobacillus sp. A5]MCP3025428.1 hypothetical protein [Halobacillus sp. A5]
MSEKPIEYQIVENSQKIKDHERRLQNIENDTKSMNTLALLMEQQTEINKEQNETLKNVNDNLTSLNNRFENVEVRVDELEKNDQIKKKAVRSFLKNVLYKFVLPILTGLLIIALTVYFGLQ